MRKRILLVIVLCACLAGCASDDVEPQPSFIDGRFLELEDDGEYTVTGPIYYSATATESVEFEDVAVCAFDDRGNVLASDSIDVLRSNESRYNISLTMNEQPRYIVADHPRFAEYDFDSSITLVTNTSYTLIGPRDIDNLTYRHPAEPGQCGTLE